MRVVVIRGAAVYEYGNPRIRQEKEASAHLRPRRKSPKIAENHQKFLMKHEDFSAPGVETYDKQKNSEVIRKNYSK